MRLILITLMLLIPLVGVNGQGKNIEPPADSLVQRANQWFDSLSGTDYFVKDEVAITFVNDIARDLLIASGYSPDSFQVFIQNSLVINAAMYPNGNLILTSGLLLRLNSRAELAMVIGHELGHYLQRHFSEPLAKNLNEANLQSFIHEYEADSAGFVLLVSAGLPATSAVSCLEKLPPQSGTLVLSLKVPFFRKRRGQVGRLTHPPTPKRVERIQRQVDLTDDTAHGVEDNYHEQLAALRNSTRWNMLLEGEERGNNTLQIIIIDSIINNLPTQELGEYDGFLRFQQSEAILKLLRGGSAVLDMRYGQARLTYRNNDLEAEKSYYDIKLSDLVSSKSVKEAHDLFNPKLQENLTLLSTMGGYQVEAMRLKGLYLDFMGQYTEARQVFTEYLAQNPTHPGRRYARALLQRMPKRDRKKSKFK